MEDPGKNGCLLARTLVKNNNSLAPKNLYCESEVYYKEEDKRAPLKLADIYLATTEKLNNIDKVALHFDEMCSRDQD